MAYFNKVVLMGNLTRDPETRELSSGTSVTDFSVALSRKYKKGDEEVEECSFVDCTAWAKTGETIAKFFTKGKPILVEGRLKQDRWEKDGEKRSKVGVVVETFSFVGSKADNDRVTSAPSAPVSDNKAMTEEDEDLPF